MEQVWTKEHEKLADMLIAKENICEAWTIGIGAMCKDHQHTIQMIEFLKTYPNATEKECVDMAYKISGYPRYQTKH